MSLQGLPRVAWRGVGTLAALATLMASSPRPVAASALRIALEAATAQVALDREQAADSIAAAALAEWHAANADDSLAVAALVYCRVHFHIKVVRTPSADLMKQAEDALAIRLKLLGPDASSTGDMLYRLGQLYYYFPGDLPRGADYFRQAVRVRSTHVTEAPADLVVALGEWGNTQFDMGDYDRADSLYHIAYDIGFARIGADSAVTLSEMLRMGNVRYYQGDYVAARLDYERVLEGRRRTLPPDDLGIAGIENNLAALDGDMGDHEAAGLLLENALAIRRRPAVVDRSGLAASLQNLGTNHFALGDLAGAESLIDSALVVARGFERPDHPDIIEMLTSLARVQAMRGEREAALVASRSAWALQVQSLGPEHPDLADAALSLGEVRMETGDTAGADSAFACASRVATRSFGEDHPVAAESELAHAFSRLALGDSAAAWRLALRSAGISRRHIARTAAGMPERQALAYERLRSQAIDLVVALAAHGGPGRRTAALDEVIRSRALVLDARAAAVRMAGTSAAADSMRLLMLTVSRLYSAAVLRGPDPSDPASYRRVLDSLDARRSALESAQGSESRSRASGIGLAEVVHGLPPEAALVSYVTVHPPALPEHRGPRRSDAGAILAAFVVRSGVPAPQLVLLGPSRRISELVMKARASLASGNERSGADREARYRSAATILRQRIWDPLAPWVRGCRTVMVVADGPLQLIDLAALPIPAGRYLIEQGTAFHYLSCERDIVPTKMEATGTRLLAIGGVDFDRASNEGIVRAPTVAVFGFRGAPPDCRDFRSFHFAPLPQSGREVEGLRVLWLESRGRPGARQADVLQGASANETAFKMMAPGSRVIHIASHGFFIGSECDEATAVSSLGAHGRAVESLSRAGVALAGANLHPGADTNQEDGILTAEEIGSLDLSSCEWVVLSACDTGIGNWLPGEGVFGLRRAFRIAGARTVITSLWAVPDDATRNWMGRLYAAHFRDGLSTAEAMRRASLGRLEELRHRGSSTDPTEWAGFIACGDWL